MITSINIFVPIFNEAASLPLIENNILRALKVFPDVMFFFFDNASDDGTYEHLIMLEKKYKPCISVSRNAHNLGFQKNLSNIANLPTDKLILMLGANDRLYTPGLRNLREILRRGPYDLIVCSYAYVTGNNLRMLPKCDAVNDIFETSSLDEYFMKKASIPNGIMQYVIHPKHAHLFLMHEKYMSPQVAVFFDIFPGRICCALASPPLALVNRVELSGWRSTAEGIIKTHLQLAKDVISLSWCAYRKSKMKIYTFIFIRYCYLHSVISTMYRSEVEQTFWAPWRSRGLDKLLFISTIAREIIFISPLRLMNIVLVIIIALNFFRERIVSLWKKEAACRS